MKNEIHTEKEKGDFVLFVKTRCDILLDVGVCIRCTKGKTVYLTCPILKNAEKEYYC